MKLLASFGVLALLAGSVTAECPGGCSGNGVCGPRDMCFCYKNYMGNDCAERICPFGYAHVDTPKGDLDMDRSMSTSGWILDQSQMYPYKTYEWFNPSAHNEEAHFYMECSNMGICDRTTGICECFPGFDGSACQRATCANDCSKHGVCKSIATIAASADRSNKLTGVPHGNVATTYNLWDRDAGYMCECDPWFTGNDCSRRNCKVGVDPLYMAAGFPVLETFIIYTGIVPASGALDTANSWVRLRVWDNYGEFYLTDRIPILDDASAAAASLVLWENAFLNIPNDVFSQIDCEKVGTSGTLGQGVFGPKISGEKGTIIVCQYVDNPGRMRLPEIHSSYFATTGNVAQTANTRAYVTAGDRRGENWDWFTTLSPWAVTAAGTTGTNVNIQAATSPAALTVAPIAPNSIIKIRDRHLLVSAVTSTTSITLVWPYTGASFADGTSIYYSTSLTATPDATAQIVAWAVGTNTFTITAAPTSLVVGSKIFYQNAYFFVRSISVSGLTVTTDRNFNGQAADGTAVSAATDSIFIVSTPAPPTTGYYEYVSECSGRGLCARDTGICQCFKGYTDDNCDNQNILAF
ncbi:unnamed protein product [Aphanomyces euteiches]|uniref:EGF-like domain-containing protein n=2 Tax=Aphanomyces euteiches TaxID=100861 RepID=A0A6G0WB55_9STRA|nr:hypothetical protein Ae201684_017394 [Aphanomyces euteiches]KAH9088586.1 hypothetical protein Ae201684P_017195 [Aphanomyces euteiches]KAH9132276.1 hypothetical protein AeRB84_021262 [Aphanomyces euteiches]